MDRQHLVILLIIAAITLSTSFFFFKDVWQEPDSTRFYNRSCLGGSDFNTPILSKTIFNLLPCSVFAWKIFHLFIILCTISSLYYFSKKVLKNDKLFFVAFLSYFLLTILLNIEDDQLALPIIIGLTARLLSNPTWSKKIGYLIAIGFLSIFVWQGAYIPMLIILGWSIEPLLGIFLVTGGIALQIITGGVDSFNVAHIGEELISGTGFIVNDIILLLFFFAKDKKRKIKENKEIFLLFTAFNLLTFVIPKMGYYSVIPNLLMVKVLFDDNQKQWLIIAGIIALVLAPTFLLYNTYPNQRTWEVISQAVETQESGELVFNEWFLGSWFFYRGGKPTQEGGYSGEQATGLHDYYWLGLDRKGCNTLSFSGSIKFQHCP